jgi:proteasome activator subunit 4
MPPRIRRKPIVAKPRLFSANFIPHLIKPIRKRKQPLYWPSAVATDQPDDDRLSCLGLPLSLPYEVESLADMDARLEVIVTRLTECVKAREWSIGFRMWTSALNM